jgi:Type II/IV secretion system protein
MLAFLAACVRGRMNIVISGGTSSGKTTLLGVLSSFVPSEERLLTIEDAAELRLAQSHVIGLEARPATVRVQGDGVENQPLMGSTQWAPTLSPLSFLSLSVHISNKHWTPAINADAAGRSVENTIQRIHWQRRQKGGRSGLDR